MAQLQFSIIGWVNRLVGKTQFCRFSAKNRQSYTFLRKVEDFEFPKMLNIMFLVVSEHLRDRHARIRIAEKKLVCAMSREFV